MEHGPLHIHVGGNLEGGLQAASPGASQRVTINSSDGATTLQKLLELIEASDLPPESRDLVKAELVEVRAGLGPGVGPAVLLAATAALHEAAKTIKSFGIVWEAAEPYFQMLQVALGVTA